MQVLAPTLAFVTIALALPELATSAPQSPAITTRHDLAGDDLPSHSYAAKRAPAISAGGPGFLAVWSDRRSASYRSELGVTEDTDFDLYGQRLAPDGVPLDTTAFRLGWTSDRDQFPEITWSGSEWLVTWLRQPAWASNFGTEVLGVRVRPDGTLVDVSPNSFFTDPAIQMFAATGDGNGFIVAAKTGAGIVARSLGSGGLGGEVVLVPTGSAQGIDLASAQGVHLLSWGGSSTSTSVIFGQRFDAGLNSLDPAPWLLGATSASDQYPVIGTDGAGFLVAWGSFDFGSFSTAIRAARVTVAGQVLDSTPLSVTTPWIPGPQPGSVTSDGAQWFVGFELDGARVARITAGGSVLDLGGFSLRNPSSSATGSPALAPAAAGGVCAVWTRPRIGIDSDMVTAIVTSPAILGIDRMLAGSATAQLVPALASNGTDSAVAFVSMGSSSDRVLVSRLGTDGSPLDSGPIEVASAVGIESAHIATDGARYLVLYTVASASTLLRDLWMRRVGLDGALLDPAPTLLGTGRSVTCVGASGEFTVASVDGQIVSGGNRWWRVRGSDGVVTAGPTTFTTGLPNQVAAAAHAGGTVLACVDGVLNPERSGVRRGWSVRVPRRGRARC